MNTQLSFKDIEGRICVITGGAGVLGYAMAEGLAGWGARIALLGRTKEKVENAARELNETYSIDALGIQADVTNQDSVRQAYELIRKQLGVVNVLVNCAGGNSPKATTPLETMRTDGTELEQSFFGLEMEGFRHVFDLNILGTIIPTQIFARDMLEQKRGSIINISSMAATRPLTKVAGYASSKAAIDNFTKWLAVHLAPTHIRVNAIAPGFFLTEQNRFLLVDKDTGEFTPRGKKIVDHTPMGRLGEPEDLQGCLLFLASELSRFVTGTILEVDGGFGAYSGV